MRTMRNSSGTEVNVRGWVMTSNSWEYYIIGKPNSAGIALCLVDGHEQEMGDVYLPELNPYVVSRCDADGLNDIQPAPGWTWTDGNDGEE